MVSRKKMDFRVLTPESKGSRQTKQTGCKSSTVQTCMYYDSTTLNHWIGDPGDRHAGCLSHSKISRSIIAIVLEAHRWEHLPSALWDYEYFFFATLPWPTGVSSQELVRSPR
jgi:hypothetical protein